MNGKALVGEGNKRLAFALFAMGLALCVYSGASAQNVVNLPDLVISSLSATLVTPNSVKYSWTITNVGSGAANLARNNTANVTVQAMLSKDTVFGDDDDVPAGGTFMGVSSLGNLAPLASESGTFTCSFQGGISRDFQGRPATITQLPYLVLMVNPGNSLKELNKNNNTAAVGVAH